MKDKAHNQKLENSNKDFFPDGTEINPWFYENEAPQLKNLRKQYFLTDFGVLDDGKIHTEEFQNLIDFVSEKNGGVIVVPAGIFLTGAVYLKKNVNLFIAKNGMIKGSDDISDYPVCETRIEGENCKYFPALINALNLENVNIFGEGAIDGNGLRSWKAFWLRREWNPSCTNKDEQRARLLFLSNCKNVVISGIHFQNPQFWTVHLYKSSFVKISGCSFFSPKEPVKAPSTDAVDIDACSDILIKNCRMEVNDDAVALKGGKGPDADKLKENGANERIIIEDCDYGFCHGCLTLGSESVHDKNIILRRIRVKNALNLLWLKMRPDTPQLYEYVDVEEISGNVTNFLTILPWTQFFDLKGKPKPPVSRAEHITMKNCKIKCKLAYNIEKNDEQYLLSDFKLENLDLDAENSGYSIK